MSGITASAKALNDVFRNPDLGRLQFAWVGVSFATWAFAITLGVYAFDVAGAAAVGIAGLVTSLPGAIASPFGGLLGDRFSRRLVMLVSAFTSALALAAAAFAVNMDADLWIVFASAGLFTVCCSPYIPAEAALMPQLARTPQELSAANVAHSVMDNIGYLGGAVISGVLLAVTSVSVTFAVAAVFATASCLVLASMRRDSRPDYDDQVDAAGVLRQTLVGFRALLSNAQLRLIGTCVSLLFFFVGAIDVLVVLVALDLLGMSDSSVGYLNAAWGVGALVAGAGLAMLINRGQLVAGLVAGSLLVGLATALPGLWPVALMAFIGWFVIGIGFTYVEVAANTLLQRLADDEVLARVRGSLETARLASMALGAASVTVLVALAGVRPAIFVIAAILPLFAIVRWGRLRSFEMGAPVAERHFSLLRKDRIFAPLPLATLERLTHGLVELDVMSGTEVTTQGERGQRFYLIESGRVEVFENGLHRRFQGPGESFGEIALLRGNPRTATVKTTEDTRLLVLERDQFLTAVTGHARTRQIADTVIETRLATPEDN